MITAEKVYKEMLEMPIREREKLFAAIARKGFEKDLYSHQEVFDDIRRSLFTVKETAEYLEVSEITLRRWIKADKVVPKRIGRNFFFEVDALKAIKKERGKK